MQRVQVSIVGPADDRLGHRRRSCPLQDLTCWRMSATWTAMRYAWPMDLDKLRALSLTRSLFEPTTLSGAIARLGFVQADPIRAPARAQDLTLRHRVIDYRVGELERRYAELPIEEEFFVNYGFLSRDKAALLQPRTPRRTWDRTTKRRADRVLSLVRERGEVHPRDVDRELSLGRVTNYWGGTSSATTHLLDGMHYRGLLRVVRREAGIRIYAPRSEQLVERSPREQAEALLALALGKYAPLPSATFADLTSRLRRSVPQLSGELNEALKRAKEGLPRAHVAGLDWFYPEGMTDFEVPERVCFLAPFDPVVWDRLRFELFWGWAYRFEAYVPATKRKLGYYALPLLFRDQIIGWGNLAFTNGKVAPELGYLAGRPPRERAFKRELEAEIERMRAFLAG